MKPHLTPKMRQETAFLANVQQTAARHVLSDYLAFAGIPDADIADKTKLLDPFFDLMEHRYADGLYAAFTMARQALEGSRRNAQRVFYANARIDEYRKGVQRLFPQAGNIWVLGGLIFRDQVAGTKNLAGFDDADGNIIDVLNSASSLSLGAENPWLVKMDYLEDILGIRDNICATYHPGVRQAFALKKFAELYPNKSVSELTVHAESSGTIVDSIAIESVAAYAEKTSQDKTSKKILAVNGTWAGGYGSSREGTGFGADEQQVKRAGKNVWVDRLLPPPINSNKQQFMAVVHEQLQKGELGGVYLEPDVVGDLGLIATDKELLRELKQVMQAHGLPIILDCVQQLGRSGSYWGKNVDTIFADYPLLVVTTAKSASNGQPFGFTVMPKVIADAAYPLTQITTNQMNGPLLRALVVAEILQNDAFQAWLAEKSQDIVAVAQQYGFHEGHFGLRGTCLNRGFYMEDDQQVKLAQIALLVEDGVLVGATPHAIRYQPMLMEYSETNSLVARVIFKRLQMIQAGIVSPAVLEIFNKMQGMDTGLARKNL